MCGSLGKKCQFSMVRNISNHLQEQVQQQLPKIFAKIVFFPHLMNMKSTTRTAKEAERDFFQREKIMIMMLLLTRTETDPDVATPTNTSRDPQDPMSNNFANNTSIISTFIDTGVHPERSRTTTTPRISRGDYNSLFAGRPAQPAAQQDVDRGAQQLERQLIYDVQHYESLSVVIVARRSLQKSRLWTLTEKLVCEHGICVPSFPENASLSKHVQHLVDRARRVKLPAKYQLDLSGVFDYSSEDDDLLMMDAYDQPVVVEEGPQFADGMRYGAYGGYFDVERPNFSCTNAVDGSRVGAPLEANKEQKFLKVLVLCGLQGAGKSTFCTRLPQCYQRISQDVLGSRHRCLSFFNTLADAVFGASRKKEKKLLQQELYIVVDRLNHTPQQRRLWLDEARKVQKRH
ncbi:unnamed protein product, partial [Amoebophrya sp. A25]|eukprot:GSA25T00004735001.1